MRRLILAAIAAAITTATLNLPAPAEAQSTDCIDRREWNYGLDALGDENHSARRSVIETALDVQPIGYRNQFYRPGSNRVYSLAYHYCDSEQKVVIVYRKVTGSWQMALKGHIYSLRHN